MAGQPVLVLTAIESAEVVNEAQGIGVELGHKSGWPSVVAAFVRRVPVSRGHRARAFAVEHGLTARESEVLDLYTSGHDICDIAGALAIAEATVRKHVRSILIKSRAPRMTEIRRCLS